MNAIVRRLRRLENGRVGAQIQDGPTLADVIRERRCRRVAQERGVSYEQALRDHLAERQAYWADFEGNGSIVDILRYSRRRQFEASAVAEGGMAL
jgi:hypothetical protein